MTIKNIKIRKLGSSLVGSFAADYFPKQSKQVYKPRKETAKKKSIGKISAFDVRGLELAVRSLNLQRSP
jgi:hypothetical protein